MSHEAIITRKCRGFILAALLALGAGAALASEPAHRMLDVLAHEESLQNLLETISESQLKESYLRCSDAAVAGALQSGEIAVCSIVYEQLLERAFGGDFMALLSWSRSRGQDVLTRRAPVGNRRRGAAALAGRRFRDPLRGAGTRPPPSVATRGAGR